MGSVMEDRPVGWVDSPIKPAAKKKPKRMPCQKADKVKPWGHAKAARLAAREPYDGMKIVGEVVCCRKATPV